MKIVLTGGGTGGHYYPLIAVAESLWLRANEDSIQNLKLYYFSDKAYNEHVLQSQRILFTKIPSGKMGLSYSVFQKIKSLITVLFGVFTALWKLFWLYPDVVLAKGGYASVPTAVAAWILGIPVFIHESDVVPGRANVFLSKIAKLIFVSYDAARAHFPAEKTHYVGQPVRKALLHPAGEGLGALFPIESDIPLVWVMGGSLGAKKINDTVVMLLNDLLYHTQVIHQTGPNNFQEIETVTKSLLKDHPYKSRYHPVAYLDELSIRRIAGSAKVIITRAGSTLFEIAAWKMPAIVIPIPVSNADHNRKNAYAYAEYGGAVVIEEANLSDDILLSEITNIIANPELQASMAEKAYQFATPKAADDIANYLLEECYKHEARPPKEDIPISILIEEQLERQDSK